MDNRLKFLSDYNNPKHFTKTCTKCGEEKELSEFKKAKGGKFGVNSNCKECTRIYNRNNYLKKTYHISMINQRWANANPEKVKEYKRNWIRKKRAEAKLLKKSDLI